MAADTFGNRPFGLRQVDLTPYDSSTTLQTAVALPVAQRLSFRPMHDRQELYGDDAIAEVVLYNRRVEWSIEAGGISMDAYAVLTGGGVLLTGVAPNQKKEITIDNIDFPNYLRVRGRSVNARPGSDLLVTIEYGRATTSPNGELRSQEFFITGCDGLGIPHPSTKVVCRLTERSGNQVVDLAV